MSAPAPKSRPARRPAPKKSTPARSRRIVIEGSLDPITLTLVGEEYTVYPLKPSAMISLIEEIDGMQNMNEEDVENNLEAIGNISNTLVRLFREDDRDRILTRLEDFTDPLDLAHLMEVMNKLSEISQEDNNPPT